jgi:predicted ester cyclase
MSSNDLVESNKALVRRLVDHVGNDGTVELLDDLVSPGFVHHHERNRDADMHGVEVLRDWNLAVRGTLPDLHLTILQILGENDRVMFHLGGTGTYGKAPGGGGTLAGVKLTFTATAVVRVADGRLAEAWVIADTLGILEQLGIVRRPG